MMGLRYGRVWMAERVRWSKAGLDAIVVLQNFYSSATWMLNLLVWYYSCSSTSFFEIPSTHPLFTVLHHYLAMTPTPFARLAYRAFQPRLFGPQTTVRFQPPQYIAQS